MKLRGRLVHFSANLRAQDAFEPAFTFPSYSESGGMRGRAWVCGWIGPS
jgi:hypothetical protein